MIFSKRPYKQIIESDMSDEDKMQMICLQLDKLKVSSPEMSFFVDLVMTTREELAAHCESGVSVDLASKLIGNF